MTRKELVTQIRAKSSFLCVGLDPDLSKIPAHLHQYEDPIYEFNRQVIAATQAHCVAYKPNLAFYEALGPSGWITLEKTIAEIPSTHFIIADAKRGDIGNTSSLYAKTFFETYAFDAVTVAPYMGRDSIGPFLEFDDKWVILLALTSNPGSSDFQHLYTKDQQQIYEVVLETSRSWGNPNNLMFVIGATQAEALANIRQIAPDHFLLVPGVGAQGGSLREVWKYGAIDDIGLLVNSSRGIIYAGGDTPDFADQVTLAASQLHSEMTQLMREHEY